MVWTNTEGSADESFREVMDSHVYLKRSDAVRVANEFAERNGFAIYRDYAPSDDIKQWVSIDTLTLVE